MSGQLSVPVKSEVRKKPRTTDINSRIDVITKLAFLLINIIARYLLLIGLSQKLHLKAGLMDIIYYVGSGLLVEVCGIVLSWRIRPSLFYCRLYCETDLNPSTPHPPISWIWRQVATEIL